MQYDPASYDDDQALVNYVWDNYRGWMTDAESLDCKSLSLAIKQPSSLGRLPPNGFRRLTPQEAEHPREAYHKLRTQVARRILREHHLEFVVNRCAVCNRIVRTPAARQCLWCGHDWH
jgi:hypothetical protein